MDKFGVLLIKKPEGISSFDVIRKLRRVLSIKQIGHTGTLDPFAEGLLQILVGKATKIAQYLTVLDKSYEVTLEFGYQTDSGDNTGTTVRKDELEPLDIDASSLKSKVELLKEQVPPKYSAIKINGVRAYKLARNNQEFEMKPRPIEVTEFELLEYNFPYLSYRCRVSKGTYIRTISEQIAEMYGTVATTIKLKRLTVANIKVESATELRDVTPENWQELIQPIDRFMDCPVVYLNEQQNKDFWHGREVKLADDCIDADIAVIKYEETVVGLAKLKSNTVIPKKVFK